MATTEEPLVKLEHELLPPDETVRHHFISSLSSGFEISPEAGELIKLDILNSLREATHHESKISMIPTNFIIPSEVPCFNEDLILCIDVGGSTIRCGVVNLSESSIVKQVQWLLKEDEKVVNQEFFDKLVLRLYYELLDDCVRDVHWKIGITWSFPLDSKNRIITLGKGFHIDESITSAPLDQLFQAALIKSGIKGDIHAIINDSLAVNLAGLLQSSSSSECVIKSRISLIIGTGLNSCILNSSNQFINTELGFFGKLHRVTKYDYLIDQNWTNKSIKAHMYQEDLKRIFQPLELICSGRYICELARLIIIELIGLNLVQKNDYFMDEFELHGGFIAILSTPSDSIPQIQSNLKKELDIQLTLDEVEIMKDVIDIILTRSSKYVTYSIMALNEFIRSHTHQYSGSSESSQDDGIHVDFIGSFLTHCQSYQSKIVKNSKGLINLNEVKDSSIVGAAVAAFIKESTSKKLDSKP